MHIFFDRKFVCHFMYEELLDIRYFAILDHFFCMKQSIKAWVQNLRFQSTEQKEGGFTRLTVFVASLIGSIFQRRHRYF